MTWFTEYRIAWIKESVEIFGHVRREHIMKKFGVSTAIASLDLREVRARYPNLMSYDLSEKVYKATPNPGRAAGGVARAKKLSPQRRAEIAKAAAEARWATPPDS
jgi:hypothetical protein